ncbi:hypothetical protein HNQ07_000132 [Deinococcus metalli]|uniref:Uncharacterized protein n=1 Tax=Deinococcus metalli TaxID=1141878 RepID=A0A7W8NPC5_9DEIO|nr:hypothetical protein [Deinococcus metalli]MBB5374688.1 hypothetical protein [Deinococcus metalli]GHF34442.1 hypothetical protein GCM10017781_09090 [Deinococcus metalli]
MKKRAVLCLLPLALLSARAQGAQGLSATLNLKLMHGGAIVQGRVTVPKSDDVVGVWSSIGRGRLMKCSPRCVVVDSLPVEGSLQLGADSGYRVVLGGRLTAGQKISLVLRLRGGLILNVTAPVMR